MNNRQILGVLVGILALATGILAVRMVWFSPGSTDDGAAALTLVETHYLPNSGRRLSGPFTRKNLTFYLVHGDNAMTGKTPLTLEEAMGRKLVIVHETGEVDELSIENVSPSEEVFVQAGDIVKGGQQDRVLAVDLIVPARSGRVPIDSFCVEQGRWATRGAEPREEFSSSTDYVPSKELKLAAKYSKSQSEVWDKVAVSQEKLSKATNSNATSRVSRSSLQLTLENDKVRSDSGNYTNFLSDIVDKKSDVIGIVMLINGRINSVDTYGSNALFIKLWPKLLKAAATEALAETAEGASPVETKLSEIESFFEMSERAPVTDERKITDRVRMVSRESKTSVFIMTLDRGHELHRNYLMR